MLMRYPPDKNENESETFSNKHQVAKISIQNQNLSLPKHLQMYE